MNLHTWLRWLPPSALLVLLVAVACGDDDDDVRLTGNVTVFAAASLTDAFNDIREAFNEVDPDIDVEFNFQSSSALATQIEQGAPADVFASADTAQMQRVVDKDLIEGEPAVFVRNLPVIVVPSGNSANIAGPKDIANAGVKLVLAAPDVPIGNYARQIIDRLAADPAYGAAFKDAALANIVSNEANVRAVLAKIELGEADAGIVYKTDALVSGDKVKVVDIPETANVIATYPIGVVADTDNREAAEAFVAFIRGPEGQSILTAAGFDAAR